jgi:hypothetical protein
LQDFPEAVKFYVQMHHAIYPDIKKPFTLIEPGGENLPRHDLLVENHRISLKTETVDQHGTIGSLSQNSVRPSESRGHHMCSSRGLCSISTATI